ncbi:hypothetical protein CPC08DRAFT_768788 [Agrocybe pediades]|nr:hypothetical protein CPC08DRAFT_768788 [Agrocybe pediades]
MYSQTQARVGAGWKEGYALTFIFVIEASTPTRSWFTGRIEEHNFRGMSLEFTLKATQAISNISLFETSSLTPACHALFGDAIYIQQLKNDFQTTLRAKPSDGRTIVTDDKIMTLLGNIITGYIFVRDAFPAQQAPGIPPQPSPYDPPVRSLAEEKVPTRIFAWKVHTD